MKFKDYIKRYTNGKTTAEMHSHRYGYTVTIFRNGREVSRTDFSESKHGSRKKCLSAVRQLLKGLGFR